MTVKELFKQVEKKKLIEILKEHFGFVYKPQDMDWCGIKKVDSLFSRIS